MLSIKKAVGITLALSLIGAAMAQEYTLKLTPKEGTTSKYKIVIDTKLGDQDVNASGIATDKVIKVEASGNFTVENSMGELNIKLGDQQMTMPGLPTATLTLKANGEVLDAKGDAGVDGFRMARLMAFIYPDKAIKVGDKWSVETKPEKENGASPAKVEYEVIAVEKVGDVELLKVKSVFTETTGGMPVKGTGHFWIAASDSTLEKAIVEIENLMLPGVPMPISGKLQMERAK